MMKPDLTCLLLPLPAFQPSSWVTLRQRPHPFSADEALLLCQESEDYWVAWVPDCGEVRLHVNQFACRE